MDKGTFAVKPVTQYSGARYPSISCPPTCEEPGEEQEKCGPLATFGVAVIVLGLSVGVLACFDGGDTQADRPAFPDTPTGTLGPNGPDPFCTPGDVTCDGWSTVVFCDVDGMGTTSYDCNAYCVETAGSDYYSTGCNAEAADPCLCESGIVDGGAPMCTPGDVYCEDQGTAMVCNDAEYYEPVECDPYCKETYGGDWWAVGCDADAEEPCLCEYGIVDGDPPMCTPGDVYCDDPDTAMVCNDYSYYEPLECDPYCKETLGEDAYAIGCDDKAEHPCLCEYGPVDGEPVPS